MASFHRRLLLEANMFLLLALLRIRNRPKRKHKFWVRRIFQERERLGLFHTLVGELRLHDQEYFYRFMRMSPERFEHLLTLVGPSIATKLCRSRKSISPGERLALTLRFLASGDSQQSLSFSFRVGHATVSRILRQTCQAIWQVLSEQYLKPPSRTEEWIRIANKFEEQWNFPHCLGAIDRKHIAIECPQNAGSAFYNYKHFHSIVLMAICDANYCLTLIDVGGFGKDNDAGILSETVFGQAFDDNPHYLNLPKPSLVKNVSLPYVLVGDDIFPLKPYLMKPFPGKHLGEEQRVYNYRLSRARRTIENTFGILSAKWRVFRRPIRAKPDTVDKMAKATLVLHNYLRLTDNAGYIPCGFIDSEDDTGNVIPGDWRAIICNDEGGLSNFSRLAGNRYPIEAGQARNDFCKYFNNPEGQVEWQLNHVRSCGQENR